MKSVKVLLIQNSITHYNLPIYNMLGEKIHLTVAHFDPQHIHTEKHFKELFLHFRKLGPFIISKENLVLICNQYDVVICLADLHWLSLMFLGLHKKRKYKLIFWGIGVSASYKNKFDQDKKWDFMRYYFMRKADALIFYSEYPVEKYVKKGFLRNCLFIAHNTVVINRTVSEILPRDLIIFIGTFYKEKGIFDLLTAYKRAYFIDDRIPELILIGDGDEYNNIKTWIDENGLAHKIQMTGAIYDDAKLERFFLRSLACISPEQSGLSVLKSMGNGVPFITRSDSITGGERFNIINNQTGIIYNDTVELVNILQQLNQNKEHFITMGENARRFYNSYRNPDIMVKGFTDAIEYVINN